MPAVVDSKANCYFGMSNSSPTSCVQVPLLGTRLGISKKTQESHEHILPELIDVLHVCHAETSEGDPIGQ
jgi:hypothetical protein